MTGWCTAAAAAAAARVDIIGAWTSTYAGWILSQQVLLST